MSKDTKIIVVASGIAANGMKVEGVVTSVGPELTKHCWQAEARVDDIGMASSHHDTRSEATNWAKRMQKVYLEVHGGIALRKNLPVV